MKEAPFGKQCVYRLEMLIQNIQLRWVLKCLGLDKTVGPGFRAAFLFGQCRLTSWPPSSQSAGAPEILSSPSPATSLHLLQPCSTVPVVSMIHFQTSCCATTNTVLWQLIKKKQNNKKNKKKKEQQQKKTASRMVLIISCINWQRESTSTPLGTATIQNGL